MPQLNKAMPQEIRVFIPITKIDVKRRIVYGTLAAEVPDKSGEIMDYDTAKAAIQEWSDAQAEASGGKSLGNIREMHGNVAAGKLTDLVFVDDDKTVEGACEVVDDSTWNKVESGVLTGFSIGGGYAKRWMDPTNPQLKRYTPKVNEFSLVDNPCQPGATFEVIKMDGTSELRKFNQQNSAQEAQSNMTTTATAQAAADTILEVPAPEQVWKATDGSTHKSKKDALAKNAELLVTGVTAKATEALQKLDDGITVKEGGEPAAASETNTPPEQDGTAAAGADSSPAAAGAESATAGNDGGAATDAAASSDGAGVSVEKTAATGELKKGLYDVSRLADAVMCINWLMQDAAWESKVEGDASTVPAQIKSALTMLCNALKSMVNEEADELLASTDEMIMVEIEKGAPVGALAKFIRDDKDGLAKAAGATEFADRLEKAANKTDKAHLSAMKDHLGTMQASIGGMQKCMKGLGMDDGDGDMGKMAKAAGLTDEQLVKLAAFEGLSKKFDELAPQLATLTERLAKVEATPAETKGIVNTALVKKSGHEGNDGAGASPVEAELKRLIAGGASPEQTSQALIKFALSNPTAIS